MPSPKCQQICGIVLLASGLLILVVTLSGRKPLIKHIDNLIKKQIVLSPGTATYDNWYKSPVPVYDDIYVFNITNPDEFNKGEKAVLDVIGPFIYKKVMVKQQANFSGDLEYAMYFDLEYFVYDESETQKYNTKSTLNDTIFIPNVPLITVVAQIEHNKDISSNIKTILEDMVEEYERYEGVDYLTLNGSVEGVLWGMDDPIMKILYQLKLSPSPQLALQINGSSDAAALTDPTVVYTGHTDIAKVDEYYRFHGKNSSGCWGSTNANVINGTEGSVFEPLLIYNTSKAVTIYNDQLYRSVVLTYTNESSYEGISCFMYKIPDWALQNVTNNPTNVAYYAYIYSGTLNLTQCSSNVPLYVTKSMFLDADERVPENITMSEKANRSLHDTYLCVEPYTGVVVDGHKRVQINVQIEHHSANGILNKTQPAFIPLVSVDEHGSITPDLANQLKAAILIPIQVVHIGFYLLCSLGTILVLASVILQVRIFNNKYRRKGSDEERNVLVNAEQTENKAEQTENKVEQTKNKAETSDNSGTSDQFLSFDGATSRYYDPDE